MISLPFCTGYHSSVQFSHSVVSDSLWPHRLQHARPPCPSPTPRIYSNSCPLSWGCQKQNLFTTLAIFWLLPWDQKWCPSLGTKVTDHIVGIHLATDPIKSEQATGASRCNHKLWWYQFSSPNLLHSQLLILWWHGSLWHISSLASEVWSQLRSPIKC